MMHWTINELAIDTIRRDGGTQARTRIDPVTVADYAEDMEGGAKFPAVVVFFDGTDYWLSDGFHRVAAAETLGRTEIEAEIHEGTRRDALYYSIQANRTHGLRRTNEDKRRAVEVMLADEEWAKWSNREIARRCGVSLDLVNRVRQEMGDAGGMRTYITRWGTPAQMNVSGRGSQPPVSPEEGERQPPPAVSVDEARQILISHELEKTPAADRQAIEASPEVIQLINAGRLTLQEARKWLRLPVEEQLLIVNKLLSGEARTFNAARRQIREEKAAETRPSPQTLVESRVITGEHIDPALFEGQVFRVIIAAWSGGSIADAPMPQLAADDCTLFLWATWSNLPRVIEAMAAWGFEYATCLPWVKSTDDSDPIFGPGHWVEGCGEGVVVGCRGNITLPDVNDLGLFGPERPDDVYALAEQLPGPYLELFARRARPGWTAFEIKGPEPEV